MASGNPGRNNSASKGFDFVDTDDVLCSYDDYANGGAIHSDPTSLSNSGKEFHKTRIARSPMFPTSTYISPDESSNNDVVSSVERTMKKYTENILRFLEGISSRLSQLELYCYNLDKSIGEMRSELTRDHEESDTKLKSLEKHLQEVHRSVQILRDKQELADTQKELAKLHLTQKDPSSSSSQQNEEKNKSQTSDTNNTDYTPDNRSQQLALALPHQVPHQQQSIPALLPPQGMASPPQGMAPPPQPYYLQPSQVPNQTPTQNQYLPSDSPYPPQPQVNQPPQPHQMPQYQQQQQWAQQGTPQPPPPMQPQIRPSSAPSAYPPYLTNQPPNASQQLENLPSSMPMQVPYSSMPPPGGNRVDPAAYGYGTGTVRPPIQQQQPPPQQLKSQYGSQNQEYPPSGNPYMVYQNEGARIPHPHQTRYPEGAYPAPPSGGPLQGPQSNTGNNNNNNMGRPGQFTRGHPYNELVDKLVGMGYRGDHVASVIQRLEENGQSVDFNAVLDILNGHPSGGSQRGWSG